MVIAVKSELDSRTLVYPFIMACRSLGSTLVVSNNKYLRRLIDDEEFSTFKNVYILVEESGATDDVFEEYGIDVKEYDYVILDNMGALEYDKCIMLYSSSISEQFQESLDFAEEEGDFNDIVLVQVGRTASGKRVKGETGRKGVKADKDAKAGKRSKKEKVAIAAEATVKDIDGIPENYDPASKFKTRVMEHKKQQFRRFSVSFASMDDIEAFESDGKFYSFPENITKVLYEVVGRSLNVSDVEFRKGIRVK